MKQLVVAGLAVVASVVGASTVSAQSTGLVGLARRLEGQANRASQQVDSLLAHSRLNRSMMRATYDIADSANELQFMAQTQANRWRIAGELARTEAEIDELCRLVDQAETRALRGFDPPLCGCIDGLRANIEAMRCTHRELERALESCDRPAVGYGSQSVGRRDLGGRDDWYGNDPRFDDRGGHGHDHGRPSAASTTVRRSGAGWEVYNAPAPSNRSRTPRGNSGPSLTLTPQGVRFGAVTVDLSSIFN
ncbi:MAG: hypothetical protein R3B96_10560 [Pirellulaceae bacterium]